MVTTPLGQGSPCPLPRIPGTANCPTGPGGNEDDPVTVEGCVEVTNKPGESLNVSIVGDVSVVLDADQLADLLAGLQAIVDAVVDIGSLEDLEVTITNDPLTVTLDGEEITVDFGPLTDWLTDNALTVTVDGIVEVTGTVSIDPDDLQALLDALSDLSAELTAALEDQTVEIVAALQAVIDAITDMQAALEALLESILEQLQDLCVSIQNKLDAEGNPIPIDISGTVDIGNLDGFPVGIEAALAPVGITCDAEGEPNGGRLFLCKTVDEETGVESFEVKYWDPSLGATPVTYDPNTHGDTCPPAAGVPVRYTYHECRKDPKTGAKGDLIITVDLDEMTCAQAWKIDGAVTLDVPEGLLTCDCTVTNLTGCDQTLNEDGDTYTLAQSPVYIRITDCPGKPREILAFSDLEQTIPYTIQGELFDEACENLLEFPTAKPQGEIVSERSLAVDMTVGLVDNNAGIPSSTAPIYHFGDTRTHETVLGGGAVVTWVQVPTAGWSPQFAGGTGWLDTDRPDSFLMAWAAVVDPNATVANGGIKVADDGLSASVGNCTMQIGCGTSPGGCGGFPGLHPDVAAAGATVFARHVSFICCSPEFIPATTTVVATDNATGPRADVGHVQNNQLTTVTIKFREITVCLDDGTLDTYLVDNCGRIIDPRTIPPCDCWKDCPTEVTVSGLPIGDSKCAAAESGDCECAVTSERYDPDQGSQWDSISVANGVATITGTPTGSFQEQMAGVNPQCNGDLWLGRYGAYDGGPGGGATELNAGYVLGSRLNVSGNQYTLGTPRLGQCATATLQAALVEAGFTAAQATSLISTGHDGSDVLNTAGATHINGVFDGDADTPFGLCITFDKSECEDKPKDQVLFTEDVCANTLLAQLLEAQLETNVLLTALNKCACGKCDECEATCAWGASGISQEQVWEVSEGNLNWMICDDTIYAIPPGDYSNIQLAQWITTNTPYTMTVIPDPANPEKDHIIYMSIPCDCEAPSFYFGDDDPITLAAIPEFDVTCDDDDGGEEPMGDPIVCANRKMGADFTSELPGVATHTLGSLYDTNGPINAWSGTFTVTDALGGVHTFTDGATVSGMAVGATQQVTFTGTVDWTDPDTGERFVCNVNDKPISANFTVEA